MEEGGARVDVLAVTHQQDGAEPAHEDADAGRPGHGGPADRLGIPKLGDALCDDHAHGDQQDERVDEGDSCGDLAEIVLAGQAEADQSEDEGEDVDKFVPGVGDDAEGMAEVAYDDLQDHETRIQGDGDSVGVADGTALGNRQRVRMMGMRGHGLQR